MGWVRSGRDPLRAHLDPRSLARMTRGRAFAKDEAIITFCRGKKKEVSDVRFHREKKRGATLSEHAREHAREPGEERSGQVRRGGGRGEEPHLTVSWLLSFVSFVPWPSSTRRAVRRSIAFSNYSRVYDLVCAPRSVNRATREPRPIECGTRWCAIPNTRTHVSFVHAEKCSGPIRDFGVAERKYVLAGELSAARRIAAF